MATPHVAAVAALLAEHRPDWRAPNLKAALMNAAKPLPGAPVCAQGAGRVDAARLLRQPAHTSPGVHPPRPIRRMADRVLSRRFAPDHPDRIHQGVGTAMLTVACDTPSGKVMFDSTTARTPDLHITPTTGDPRCRSTFGTVHQSEKDSYHLIFHPGEIPDPTWRPSDLATVEVRHAAQGKRPQHVVKSTSPIVDGPPSRGTPSPSRNRPPAPSAARPARGPVPTPPTSSHYPFG
ncbi:S8 family serine peptidase [Actinosynnema sp. CA-248983]